METPFGPLESLVGRAFERDGIARRIKFLARGLVVTADMESELEITWSGRSFCEWILGAKEVTP